MRKLLILVGLSVAIIQTSCSSHHEEHEQETKYLITSPVKMDTTHTRDYVCQIHSIQHIEVRALEEGYLQEIYVDEGQHVKKGQLLFKILPLLYQAELQSAKAEADFAEIEYLNTKNLADSEVVSQNELAMAKAKYDKAKAQLSLASVHLGFTEIRAPFDGIIDRFQVRLGSLIEEGDLMTSLSDNSQMWVYFNVPEAEYIEYMKNSEAKNGRKVRLIMANGEQFESLGEITTIEADFDNRTGNIAFRATFPNPHGLLRHGETGNIMMDTRIYNALLIPQRATFEIMDQRYVFLLDDENVLHTTRIKIGEELSHLFVVSDGLKEGDRILLDGIRKVKDSEKIAVRFANPDSLIVNLDMYAE
ncbi:MAG: efflux RND transporter periplasmic adaptor subunit [Salibacteraceae bacterium]|jgi:membrane fusion protein, multidrug efflux system|nr:efflux RND transporter periplasmic adaptor subunit [Salibacteraceae bacterium]MDP4685577.1 efflux RND transporter periplasmic adaptor subunit [Salibacteraceae bacterium]MDP4764132.1 efflux RND transporter periplasmic adaptor subunit [Salibacteraceae bacterium]MDP4844318.1 efflux RND transporter periplasmic adaptor subunit [Salibacteraceae bacterium]MDP4965612.1 efflux RND transporter periplasmic adaptor subunit [Salibacteraceae bacterium]